MYRAYSYTRQDVLLVPTSTARSLSVLLIYTRFTTNTLSRNHTRACHTVPVCSNASEYRVHDSRCFPVLRQQVQTNASCSNLPVGPPSWYLCSMRLRSRHLRLTCQGYFRQAQPVSTAQSRRCSPGSVWLDRAYGQVLGAVVLEPRRSSIGHSRLSTEGLRWELEAPRGVSFFRTVIHPQRSEILLFFFCWVLSCISPNAPSTSACLIYLLPLPLWQLGRLLFFICH